MSEIKIAGNKAEEELRNFVENLVTEKKFDNVEPEVLQQIKEDLYERVDDVINGTIIAHLPPEKLEEFNNLLDAHNSAAIEEFTNEHVPNLQKLIADSLVEFRKIYLGQK